jgi:hypothetical protein
VEKIVSKISQIRRRLEDLLDNDFDHKREEKEKIKKTFEVSRDLSLIRGLPAGLPEDHLDRVAVLFSRMSMFFEAGIMMENQDGRWKAQAIFEKGVVETLKSQNKSSLQLPHVKVLTVLRTGARPLLEKLHLKQLDPGNSYQCLLIKVSSDFSFLLLSSLPDLWLKNHIENIQGSLQSGIAD